MTVRSWFRIVRASAWEEYLPKIEIYFRSSNPDRGPLSPVCTLMNLQSYQLLIDRGGPPLHVYDLVNRSMRETLSLRTDGLDTTPSTWVGFTYKDLTR